MMARSAALMAALPLLLVACSDGAPEPEAESTAIPRELAAPPPPPPAAAGETIGTPMAQRVATLGLLNKRNNITQDVKLRPGESRRVGDVIVRLATCERTAPWEPRAETGAFVQVLVQERAQAGEEPQWRGIFSGWLFRNSPSLNVVEHPIYDVWIKDCAMSFPGEEATPRARSTSGAASPRPAPTPTATSTAAPASEPAPAPAPVAVPEAADSTAQ